MLTTEIPILLYHQINPIKPAYNTKPFTMLTDQFERQMHYLFKHGYNCVSLIDFLPHNTAKLPKRQKFFAISFDDGYADFLSEAYPVLHRYGFTATIFVVTNLVGRQSNWKGEQGSPLLNWDQIRTLQQAGFSFGSHTCSHTSLIQLSNKQVWHEISVSKQRLEAELGQEISLLSYPYGESNDAIQTMAKAAGYKAACGVSRCKKGTFNLWRNECHQDTPQTIAFRLSNQYRYAQWMRRWLREKIVVAQPSISPHNDNSFNYSLMSFPTEE